MSDKTCGECGHFRGVSFGLEDDCLSFCSLTSEGVYEFDKACDKYVPAKGTFKQRGDEASEDR